MAFEHHYYDEQFKKYLAQFMTIFANMQVKIGKRDSEEEQLITAPIQYGFKDRIVASIVSDYTQNKPLRLPMMSAHLSGIAMAPELRKGIGTERRQTYMPRGEVYPDDLKVARQLMPVPYRANAELAIYTSNTDQRFQILEQILMLFDQTIQIQKSDAPFDWTKLTTVELENISFEDNYPSGTDRRIMVSTLTFNFPVYISAPTNLREEYIKDIYMRLGTVSTGADSSEEMIAEIDAQGIEYEKIFDLDDLNLP